jgi:hypothetical protein
VANLTDEEMAHLFQLRRLTQNRKRELEKQVAEYGAAAPAHLRLEIKTADEELRRIESSLKLAAISPVVRDATGPEAGIDVLRVEVKELRDQLSELYRFVTREILEMKEDSRIWREGAAYYRKLTWWGVAGGTAIILGLLLLLAYRLGAGG